VFAGGEDIHPARYGRAGDLARCFPPDPRRDAREWFLLEAALARRVPVLGVCRGMQVVNVFLGGTLVVDLPSDRPSDVVHGTSDRFVRHDVVLEPGSLLHAGAAPVARTVNSWHHQAVDRPGRGVRVIARAADGVVEAIEGTDADRFVLGVQWHPERPMPPALSALPARRFLAACRIR
jgi:putative glutamine amidotransferase